LQDFPTDEEFPLTKEFPQLKPENLTKGWASTYLNASDGNGIGRLDREQSELRAKQAARSDASLKATMDSVFGDIDDSVRRDLGLSVRKPSLMKKQAPKTIMSRSAANALQTRPTSRVQGTLSGKISSQPSLSLATNKTRNIPIMERSARAPLVNASKNTLGYARGRAMSSKGPSERKPAAAAVFRDDEAEFDRAVRSVVEGLRRQTLVDETSLDSLGEVDTEELGGDGIESFDNEWDDFQLSMPSASGD
jgi:hypothetical protein